MASKSKKKDKKKLSKETITLLEHLKVSHPATFRQMLGLAKTLAGSKEK